MMEPVKISAVIIALNEEHKIGLCLESLRGVADEIIVVDSLSSDRTEQVCREHKVVFIPHAFEGYVAQKNFAMAQATYDYILALDADERLSDELRSSLMEVKSNWGAYDGYCFNRLNNYCGTWLRHAWYPDVKIRLWNRTRGKWGGIDPHDQVIIASNNVKKLSGDLIHYAYESIDEHIQQVFKFSMVAAEAKYKRGQKAPVMSKVLFSPVYAFIKIYILKRGFLDGYYGFMFSASASVLTFLKYFRLHEYHKKTKEALKKKIH